MLFRCIGRVLDSLRNPSIRSREYISEPVDYIFGNCHQIFLLVAAFVFMVSTPIVGISRFAPQRQPTQDANTGRSPVTSPLPVCHDGSM